MQLKHIIVLNCPRLSVGGAGGKPGFTPNIVISDTNVGLGHKILWQTKEQKYVALSTCKYRKTLGTQIQFLVVTQNNACRSR
jgi:hypothetical protein